MVFGALGQLYTYDHDFSVYINKNIIKCIYIYTYICKFIGVDTAGSIRYPALTISGSPHILSLQWMTGKCPNTNAPSATERVSKNEGNASGPLVS